MTAVEDRESRVEGQSSAFTTTIENGMAVVSFDLPGEPVNKLNCRRED